MTTQRSHHRSRHWRAAGQAGARLGRLATVLAAVISGLLASAAAVPAAFANPVPVGDGGTIPIAPAPATTGRVISTGGMAGWQGTRLRRLAAVLAAATCALLASAAAVPAAFARVVPPPPDAYPGRIVPASDPASVPAQVQVRTIVAGGMPGWQIALIAIGAALLAAVAAVLLDRALGARRAAGATA